MATPRLAQLKKNARQHLLALLYFALLMLGMTYPLITVFHTHFIGDLFSDAYEYSHHIWWMNHAMRTVQSIFHLVPLAYPDGLNGAWLWGNPLQSFPAWLFLFVMPLPAAYNLAALINLTLNGWMTYFLGWHLTKNTWAAILAGTIFALYPTIQGHLIASHTGLIILWGAPLYILALLHLKDNLHVKGVAITALCFVLSILGNSLLLVYVLFPITAIFAIERLRLKQWRWLGAIVLSAFIGGLLALIFIAPVALEQVNSPIPSDGGDIQYSADFLATVTPSFYNPLFTDLTYSRRILGGINNVEGTAYIGIIAAVLAIIGFINVRESRWWGRLAIFGWILSLGPLLKVMDRLVTVNLGGYDTHIVLPWAALMNIPVLNIARTPARFNFVIGLSIAILAAYGLQWFYQHQLKTNWLRLGLIIILIPMIAFEYQVWWENGLPELRTIIDLQADPITALRDDESVRAVFNIPYTHLLTAKDGMMLQTQHQKPIIAGHVTRRTPVNPAKLAILEGSLDPALLKSIGADVVILHRYWSDEKLEPFARDQLGTPFYEDERLLAWYTPQTGASTEFVVMPFTGDKFTRQATSYAYVPADGWITFNADLNAKNATIKLLLDGASVQQWNITDSQSINLRLPLTTGYHSVVLQTHSTCPRSPNPSLICPSVIIDNLSLTNFSTGDLSQPILFERGITLSAFDVKHTRNAIDVALGWQFDQTVTDTDIRFVHVLNEYGETVMQSDISLGTFSADTTHIETLTFNDMPSGTYTVYLGWYTYPDLTRREILADVPDAANRWIELETITIPDES